MTSVFQRLFTAKPSAPPQQVLGLKVYKAPEPPKVKTIGPHSRAEDLIECVGPGSYRIRVPRDRDPRVDSWLGRDPFSLAQEMTNARLLKESLDGTLDWPDGFEPPKPKSRVEQRAERVATMRRIASGPREFAALLENEGFNPQEHPWEEPSTDQQKESTERRTARELLGLMRARIFGK